jgi:hypothetical protein
MIHAFGRAKASPGKHGDGDFRVELSGIAPAHAEMVFILGMCLISEDRYKSPALGRYMLWQFIDLLASAKTPERVIEIAQDCQESVDGHYGFREDTA